MLGSVGPIVDLEPLVWLINEQENMMAKSTVPNGTNTRENNFSKARTFANKANVIKNNGPGAT